MRELPAIARQQLWLNQLRSAGAVNGRVADYALAEGPTPIELQLWKIILSRRDLLPSKKGSSDFVKVVIPLPVSSAGMSLDIAKWRAAGVRRRAQAWENTVNGNSGESVAVIRATGNVRIHLY